MNSFPPRSKCSNLSLYDFPDHTNVLMLLENHNKIFSNTYLGFDLHFDMQKLIPQTQLLMCRIQFKKRERDRKHYHRWCSPFLRTLIKGKWCNKPSVMWLAQFCTHLLHHLLIFVLKPRVVPGTERSIVQYKAYSGNVWCRETVWERDRPTATEINPAPIPLLMSACSLLMLS